MYAGRRAWLSTILLLRICKWATKFDKPGPACSGLIMMPELFVSVFDVIRMSTALALKISMPFSFPLIMLLATIHCEADQSKVA